MDEELRSRYRIERRDYAMPPARPSHRPQPARHPSPNPPPSPAHHRPQPPAHNAPHQAPAPQQGHHRNPFMTAAGAPVYSHRPASHTPERSKPPRSVPETPAHQPITTAKAKKPKRYKKILLIMTIVSALAAAGVGGALWAYPKYLKSDPFTADIKNQAAVPLLYPNKLPPGYSISPASIHYANNSTIYDATNGDKRLVFTIQKTVKGFDFEKFYSEQFTNSQQFTTPLGQVVIGKNDNRSLGSLVSGGTWLLLSTNSQSVSYNDMAFVMHNLKKY